MSTAPIMLDLFSGEGGTGEGWRRAGWDVRCVDINAARLQRNPHPSTCADALEVLSELINGTSAFRGVTAIAAGPPCQGYTRALLGHPDIAARWPRLIGATRELLKQTGLPYIIENVEQARAQMKDPILLCGRMFGLRAIDEDGEPLTLDRHRLFESNVPLTAPHHPPHRGEQVAGVYGGSRRAQRRPGESLAEVAPRDRHAARHERKGGYVPRSKRVQRQLLGIDWMTIRGMQESIPPAYSEHLGRQLLEYIRKAA